MEQKENILKLHDDFKAPFKRLRKLTISKRNKENNKISEVDYKNICKEIDLILNFEIDFSRLIYKIKKGK